jgi:hypothetical protein
LAVQGGEREAAHLKELAVGSLQVVDESGAVAVRIDGEKLDGRRGIGLYDNEGRERVRLDLDGQGGLDFAYENPDSHMSAMLTTATNGSLVLYLGNPTQESRLAIIMEKGGDLRIEGTEHGKRRITLPSD